MSFNDFNDLEAPPSSFSNPTNASPEYSSLTKAITQKIFSITSNVTLIHRYIGLLGTSRDTEKMRSSLMDALGKTKTMIKEIMSNIRQLSNWEEIGPGEKYEQRKLTDDFQKAAIDFQNAQRLALEKQKDYVKHAKATIEEAHTDEEEHHGQQQLQQEQGIKLLDDAEIEFNEQLIEEREVEIQGIEQGILELAEIFRDLATIVVEQGSMIGELLSVAPANKDNIDQNAISIRDHTAKGATELTSASQFQKNARKRACWLMLILCIIFTVVLLAVCPTLSY